MMAAHTQNLWALTNAYKSRGEPMNKQITLEELLDEIAAATRSAEHSQDSADDVIRAIRALERALQEKLDGNTLRGLKNLGHSRDPLYGARIRGQSDARVKWPDRENAMSEALFLSPQGILRVAACRTDEHGDMFDLEVRDAVDDDFVIEDLADFLKTLIDVGPRTVTYATKARERYAGIRELAINAMRLLTGGTHE
jgi:hypothetical protein